MLNPFHWAPAPVAGCSVISIGFAMTGFFVSELNQRRRLLAAHIKEREDAEQQVRVLIETSPLAILTLDHPGRVAAGQRVRPRAARLRRRIRCRARRSTPYLPILDRLLHSHRSGDNMRTSVECKGQRRNGEVFLAHVWLSTYRTSDGPGWPPWSGTPARTCATAKAPGSIP